MSVVFVQTEAMVFSLSIMVFLFVFMKKTFDCICREYNFIFLFSIGGTLCSLLRGILPYAYIQNLLFVLCGCCYAVSAFFLCQYVFIKEKTENKKFLFLIPAAVVGLLTFCSLIYGVNIITYLMTFVILSIFIVDQFNKIRIDKLTGLYNRYGLDLELKKQLKQYKRENTDSFYVIACDLDKFKQINDRWGHLEGDRALKLVADTLLKASERFNSAVFRIGGDEFAIITDTSEEGLALEITDAIKKEFDNIEFRDDFDLHISIGNALYDGIIAIKDLLGSADKKLYEAKRKTVER